MAGSTGGGWRHTQQWLGSTQRKGNAPPLAPQGNFNVNQAAAGGLQQAMQGTQRAMAGPNIGQFMNPYTSMVTGALLATLSVSVRWPVRTTTGARGDAGRRIGGSRHGVAEALTNEGFARQGAQTFGNLQQQGFNTARRGAGSAGLADGWRGSAWQLGQQAFKHRPSDQPADAAGSHAARLAAVAHRRGSRPSTRAYALAHHSRPLSHCRWRLLGVNAKPPVNDHAAVRTLDCSTTCRLDATGVRSLRHPPQERHQAARQRERPQRLLLGVDRRGQAHRRSVTAEGWRHGSGASGRIRISSSSAQTASSALTTADWRRRRPDGPTGLVTHPARHFRRRERRRLRRSSAIRTAPTGGFLALT